MVKNGRYGPYVSHNGVNATLTGDKTPDTVTLDEAIVLLDARVSRDGQFAKGPPRRRAQAALRQGGQPIRRQNQRPIGQRKPRGASKAKKPAAIAAKAKPARRTKAAAE